MKKHPAEVPALKQKLFSVSIHDCDVDTFRTGGNGGQNRNKVETGVRVTHQPSGAIGEGREYNSQPQNKRCAFVRMARTIRFQSWAKETAARLQGKETVDMAVERQMQPQNLVVEMREDDQWVPFREQRPGKLPKEKP